MYRQVLTACAMALALLNTESTAQGQKLLDPGFESFKLAKAPIYGWFSDDVVRPDDRQFAAVKMTPDNEIKTEGQYSLRIEQLRARPRERGQASLSQAVAIAKEGGNRSFDLAMQTRGRLHGPLTVEIYVWKPGNIASSIAKVDAAVKTEWSTATLSFKVPNGYDQFGIFIYLPRDNEAQVWLDDIRLEAKSK